MPGMDPVNTQDVGYNPFRIMAHDGFGHYTMIEEYGYELIAVRRYGEIVGSNTKYPQIDLIEIKRSAVRPDVSHPE